MMFSDTQISYSFNMIRLLAEPILIRALIPLPISQHIRGSSLNHTLHHAQSQL